MSRKSKVLLVALLVIAICASTVGQSPQLSIPIVNADFESTDVSGAGAITSPPGCGTGQNFDHILGWTFVHVLAGSGGGVAHWTCDDGMPNSNVASLGYGEAMYQITSEKGRQGTYVLQFDTSDWFYSYSGDWLAALYTAEPDPNGNFVDVNGNKWTLSQAPFCSGSGWALGDMGRKTVTCSLSGGFINPANVNPDGTLSVAGQVAGNIAIRFQNGAPNPALGGHAGWPLLLDNVTLTFTPSN